MSIEATLQDFVDENDIEGVYSLRESILENEIPIKKALNKSVKNNYTEIAGFLSGLANEMDIPIAFKTVAIAYENGNIPLVNTLLNGDISMDSEDESFISILDDGDRDVIERILGTAIRLLNLDVIDLILSNYLNPTKNYLTNLLQDIVDKIEQGELDPEETFDTVYLLINKGANTKKINQLKNSKNIEKTLLNFKLIKPKKKTSPAMTQEEVIVETYTKPSSAKTKITTKYLTKYELAKVLGVRATQIANGEPTLIDTKGETDPLKIALLEIKQKKIPLVIRRPLPDGSYEEWPVKDLFYE